MAELADSLQKLEISQAADDVPRARLSPEEHEKRDVWIKMQDKMKLDLIEEDREDVHGWIKDQNPFGRLYFIAGVDISFQKDSPTTACAMLTILTFPELEVAHVCSAMVEMTEPYIPGFLAFREVEFLLERLESIKMNFPQLTPQVIFVDGNGVLHPRGFGLASHLGVLSGIPCVGVGKKLFHVDGLENGQPHRQQVTRELMKKGDHFLLRGKSNRIWGAAVRTSDDASNPVYVSVGHKIALETAIKLTLACSIKRVPEPIRQADHQSRRIVSTQCK